MKKSGSTNQITDFSLLIIAVFLTLLSAFVGYRCCRRKRSSGKKKHLQREIRKAFSRKSQKSSLLLKETSLNTLEKELNDQSEDKKIISSSTKKSPVSSTPKSGDKYRNTEKENKKANVPKFLSILSRIWRREEDIESGQHLLPDSPRETVPITSTMSTDKNKDSRNARTQSSTSYKETPREKKSQSKKPKVGDIEIKDSEIKGFVSLKSREAGHQSANLLLSKDVSQEKKRNKRSSPPCGCTHCTGSDCKKCKLHGESIDSNKTPVVTQTESIPHQEKSSKKLIYNSDDSAMEVEPRTSKSDTNSSPPKSPNDDFLMVDLEEKEHEDSSTDDATVSHASSAHSSVTRIEDVYVVIGETKENTTEKTTECFLVSENKQDLEMIEELSIQKLIKKTGPQSMEDSTTHDGPMDNKEVAYVNVYHGKRLESVGNVYDVLEYASREWKGHTTKAEAIRKGYFEVRKELGLRTLRVVRGDNYCAIRATLFQALAKKISILAKFKEIHAIPRQLVSEGFDWIRYWNFGARFHVERSEVCKKMEECLKDLYDLVNLSSKMENEEGRVSHLLSSLNYKHEDYELRLMEAVKFLMLASAIELHKLMSHDSDIPVFAMIMFARDTSLNPCEFMKRHLNAVGDTGGLEQVEMCLLGYTLGITIQVVRPSHFGKPDFIASYPDEMPVRTPSVTLVAEDDRHYNILS